MSAIRKIEPLSIINEINEALSLSDEPQQRLNMALDTLAGVLGIDCCWVQLMSPDRQKLILAASHGFTPSIKQEMLSVSMKHSLSKEVFGLGHKVIIPDLSRDRTYGFNSFNKAGLASIVAVPIRTYRTYGIMGVASRRRKGFRKEVSELLTTIGGIIINAFSKADSYQAALGGEKDLSNRGLLKTISGPNEGNTGSQSIIEIIGTDKKLENKEELEAYSGNNCVVLDQAEHQFKEHNRIMKEFIKAHLTGPGR